MNIGFITLRRRSHSLLKEIPSLPRSAWRVVELDVPTRNVSFHRRAHLPIILASNLINNPVKVPWWNGLTLCLTTYQG
jgi:hypothetical protein